MKQMIIIHAYQHILPQQDVIITFDADNINDFNDWYPEELCSIKHI